MNQRGTGEARYSSQSTGSATASPANSSGSDTSVGYSVTIQQKIDGITLQSIRVTAGPSTIDGEAIVTPQCSAPRKVRIDAA